MYEALWVAKLGNNNGTATGIHNLLPLLGFNVNCESRLLSSNRVHTKYVNQNSLTIA